MQKIAFVVSYDGTNYAGFQRQPNQQTVQGMLERALQKITGEEIQIHSSGRTDAGVHAFGQVIHFTTKQRIPASQWPLALRKYLPRDIIVREAYEVGEDFHARYDAISKEYHYTIDCGQVPNVFWRLYAHHLPYKVDLDLIEQALPLFIGTYDFSAFTTTGCTVNNRERTINQLSMQRDEERLIFIIQGNGFLYKMVRIIIGTLLKVGQGRTKPEQIIRALNLEGVDGLGIPAPPHGLSLHRVDYPPEKLTYNLF